MGVRFQSTRPRGARPRGMSGFNMQIQFQSTRPRGARHYVRAYTIPNNPFQSTRPRGARLRQLWSDCGGGWFQSTRPRGARPKTSEIRAPDDRCFNPRAHPHGLYLVYLVSIHAPTRGATRPSPRPLLGILSFNPRAHAGRDRPSPRPLLGYISFNPRAHAGRDRRRDIFGRSLLPVSIHAPTRGATLKI